MLPDPGFLFLSKKHQAALTLLEYGLLNHVGFCVISGEPGAGKTTILRALLDRADDDVTVGLITNTHQSFGGLLDWILSSFDLHRPNQSHVEMHQSFMNFLIEEYAHKRTVLLIVDEAQNMNADMLEELRMLSNVNSAKDQLMQVVLAGQPALRDTLRRPELMQFAQRIAVDYHLNPLNLEETCGYIQHRLATAGAERDVFTPAACERIYTYSGGTPRLINLLCETVLVYGFADQQDMIDVDLVDEMVQERMKDSVVPLVNRDVAKQDNKEISKQLEKDFPWIRPEGGTKGLKPSDDINPDEMPVTSARPVKPEVFTSEETALEMNDISNSEKAVASVIENTVPTKKNAKINAKKELEAEVKTELEKEPETELEAELEAEVEAEVPASAIQSTSTPSRIFVEVEKNISSPNKPAESKIDTGNQLLKYGLMALFIAAILIALALALNDANGKEPVVVNDEILELQKQQELQEQQKQREQEAVRLKQLQVEAETLRKERDEALVKIEQEKLAKQEAERLAAEKAALAVKAAEDRRQREEKKKIAEAKGRERQAKQAEARAKAEAERAKLEAANLEEEKRLMQARLEEEIRLKHEQEARRMELELQEQHRLAMDEEKNRLQSQADVEEVIDKAKKNTAECNGPLARFKSSCR